MLAKKIKIFNRKIFYSFYLNIKFVSGQLFYLSNQGKPTIISVKIGFNMNIKKNAMVSISMNLSDENGNMIEDNNEEIIYLHGGYGHLFKKLEEELEGKSIGDNFNIKLNAAEAFGEFDEELVSRELLSDLPEDVEVGMELDGEVEGVIFKVLELDKTHALIDGNHPYAGLPLIAKGSVLEIEYLNEATVEKVLEDDHHH